MVSSRATKIMLPRRHMDTEAQHTPGTINLGIHTINNKFAFLSGHFHNVWLGNEVFENNQ